MIFNSTFLQIFKKKIETRRDDGCFYLCHLQRGTSDLLEGLKKVSLGLFFTPKLPLNPILT